MVGETMSSQPSLLVLSLSVSLSLSTYLSIYLSFYLSMSLSLSLCLFSREQDFKREKMPGVSLINTSWLQPSPSQLSVSHSPVPRQHGVGHSPPGILTVPAGRKRERERERQAMPPS